MQETSNATLWLIAHEIPEYVMAGDAGDGPPAKARPHPPIRSEFGRKFAETLKALEQATVDSFDQVFGEAKRLFRERYDAEIHVDGGFKKRVLDDAAVRRSLVDVVEALESLPVKVTRENPALRHVFLGEDPPESNWRGWYSWGFDAIHVSRRAFGLMPRYTPDRPNAVYETVLHETGHAVHWWLGAARSKPFFDATWDLPAQRQGEGIWGFGGLYTKVTGTIKSKEGITDYGARDPLEDWADTWRILALPDGDERRRRVLSRVTGREHERFGMMRRILMISGMGVPGER